MSAPVPDRLVAAHQLALATLPPGDRPPLGDVEWRIAQDGRSVYVVAGITSGEVRTGAPANAADVKADGAADAVDALLSGADDLLALLAAGRLRLSGRTSAVGALVSFLPALTAAAEAPDQNGGSAPGAGAPALPGDDELAGLGLPLELTSSPIDQMLLVALILRSMPGHERAERRGRLLRALPDGPAGATALTRLLISSADLAAGNSDHLAQRAELEAPAAPEL